MGSRDDYQTLAGVLQAFAGQQTWRQVELARRVEVESRRLRVILERLVEYGMPLEREEEHPHVIWSVPKKWFPGGVFLDLEDCDVLLRAVLQLSDPVRRKKLLERLLLGRRIAGSIESHVERLEQSLVALPVAPEEERALVIVQEALLHGKALSMRYVSTSRGGVLGRRVVSPLRVMTGPPARLVAYCHQNAALRWFRLDNIERAALEQEEVPVVVAPGELDAFIAASPDGYHDGTDEEHSFIVAASAAAWVRGNLLPGMSVEEEARGAIRVRVRGGALIVARFVACLGKEARGDTLKLRELVCSVARGALEANRESADF